MKSLRFLAFACFLFLYGTFGPLYALDVASGKSFFEQNCAICHADTLGAGNVHQSRQGPSLVGVLGRRAGSLTGFGFSQALAQYGVIWDEATLNQYLTNPIGVVPGTTMPIPILDPIHRQNVIAYLATLKAPQGKMMSTFVPSDSSKSNNPHDWRQAMPGLKHHIKTTDLPKPFETQSVGNKPVVIPPPPGVTLAVPSKFVVKQLLSGLSNPRIIQTAPNGDLFVAEPGNKIRVLRTSESGESVSINQIFADRLEGPFGMAFYPLGENPKWLYIACNNSIVRFPYQNGDTKASGPAQTIVAKLSETSGGHSTRDIAFSRDGKRLYISVGSSSNLAEKMKPKSPEEIKTWENDHGLGAAWDADAQRANILMTDPEGKEPLKVYATGIRNPVGLAIQEETGDLWTTCNERDGMGDDLVPDYATRVKEGGFYGWPWYYLGNFEDPRMKIKRPDLLGKAIVPDVLLQSHSAALGLCFYTAKTGSSVFPKEYHGDLFVAMHGSWNRSTRTGYKIVRVRMNHGVPTGEYEDFMTGFVIDEKNVWGRPVGVTVAKDGSLLVSEDGNKSIWRISYSNP